MLFGSYRHWEPRRLQTPAGCSPKTCLAAPLALASTCEAGPSTWSPTTFVLEEHRRPRQQATVSASPMMDSPQRAPLEPAPVIAPVEAPPMDSPSSSGSSARPWPSAAAPPLRRRYSMDEDMLYNQIAALPLRWPSQPPPYRLTPPDDDHGRPRGRPEAEGKQPADVDGGSELLPGYQSTLSLESVFSKKHEIENTTKRAEDRHWHAVYVVLQGTALNIYGVKKDWGWGRTRDGPTISPDNPPWLRRGRLEKSYSLLHADAGIAADYPKRRYVIRVRAETDQFLLSCVELSTFIKWLESLFAAIDLAAPLDDREFPRDMSIPRVQRIRWLRGHAPGLGGFAAASTPTTQEADDLPLVADDAALGTTARPPSRSTPDAREPGQVLPEQRSPPPQPRSPASGKQQALPRDGSGGPPRFGPRRRFSTTTYPNISIDPHTGKWFPDHQWSSAHDLLYAKLCYSNLLFRSPRKSDYIINKGKQWFVDWGTGRMVRVLPPTYGEIDFLGPWQVVHTENVRI